MSEFGLGWLPSPSDPRDFPISGLYAAMGVEPAAVIPDTYTAPAPMPTVFNQGSTPECVAYSSGAMKVYEELRDSGAFTPAFDTFFASIGGGPNGAYVRDAFGQMLAAGYPPNPAVHKIAAYYAVPVTEADIQQAILAFGPIVIGTGWYNSWFSPHLGILPAPSGGLAGGHAILACGWDARGLHLRNSWGSSWGLGGDCFLPWAYLGAVGEAWKAVDMVTGPTSKPYVITTLEAFNPPVAATFPAFRCISGYDPDRPGKVIKKWLGRKASIAHVDALVNIRWTAYAPSDQHAPTPHGGPFAHIMDGTLAGLYVAASQLGIPKQGDSL